MKIYYYDTDNGNKLKETEEINLSVSKYRYVVLQFLATSNKNEAIVCTHSPFYSFGKEVKGVITCFNPEITLNTDCPLPIFVGFDLVKAPLGMAKTTLNIGGKKIKIFFEIDDTPVFHSGTEEALGLSRLKFLNSNLFKDKNIIKSYTGIKFNKNVATLCGKNIIFAKTGLPENVVSFFDESNTLCDCPQKNLFFKNVEFNLEGYEFSFSSLKSIVSERSVKLSTKGINQRLTLETTAKLWYDGTLSYKIKVSAIEDTIIKNINFNVGFDASKYVIGLEKGETLLKDLWANGGHSDLTAFVGDINIGARIKLFIDESSWYNYKNGKIEFSDDEKGKTLTANTDMLILPKGKSVEFAFEMLFTPLKPIDLTTQFGQNITIGDLNSAKCHKQNYIVHPKLPIDNFVYPYLDEIKESVIKAHSHDVGVIMPFKLNYIDQENHDFALFSALNVENYDNYNLEVLNYLANSVGIDGVILDSNTVTWESVERVAKLFEAKRGRKSLIELGCDFKNSTWNTLLEHAEVMPFIGGLVIQNGDYKVPKDVLIGLSGILYGNLAQTTDLNINPIAALLYGIRLRQGCGYLGNDILLSEINHLFAKLDVKNGQLRGYWDSNNPLTCDNPNVYITSYICGESLLAAIYNYGDKDYEFNIGINPKKSFTSVGKKIIAPLIHGLQKEQKINPNKPLKLKKHKGMIVTITK